MLLSLSFFDYSQIAILTVLFYQFYVWLAHDNTKPLLLWFLSYAGLWAISWLLPLTVLNIILSVAFPLFGMILVLIHKTEIQKNCVAAQRIDVTPELYNPDWMLLVLQTALLHMKKNKTVSFLIEQNDILDRYLQFECALQAPLNKKTLSLLLESSQYDQNKFVQIDCMGTIKGINVYWKQQKVEKILVLPNSDSHWAHDALLYTGLTDALILKTDIDTATFTVYYQSTEVKHLSAIQTELLLKKLVMKHPNNCLIKKESHAQAHETGRSVEFNP